MLLVRRRLAVAECQALAPPRWRFNLGSGPYQASRYQGSRLQGLEVYHVIGYHLMSPGCLVGTLRSGNWKVLYSESFGSTGDSNLYRLVLVTHTCPHQHIIIPPDRLVLGCMFLVRARWEALHHRRALWSDKVRYRVTRACHAFVPREPVLFWW